MDNSNTPSASPYIVEDFQGLLQVYSDGSIVRSVPAIFNSPLVHEDNGPVLWKQLIFNSAHHNLPLRLYKPSSSSSSSSADNTKLPLVTWFHGGGFCIGSCTWSLFHNWCVRLASDLQALILAPDYRLAPEHRLPSAVDDGFAALMWVREQAAFKNNRDEWWTDVDFGRVFVCGESAGGTLSHHLMVRLGATDSAGLTPPVRVRGYVLVNPFFGGTVRTKSEAQGPLDCSLNLVEIDRCWRLAVPVGETADHPSANPFGPSSPSLESLSLDPILVVCASKDLLRDRNEDYVRRLRDWGKKIEYREFKGEQHGFYVLDPYSDSSTKLIQIIGHFIAENSN